MVLLWPVEGTVMYHICFTCQHYPTQVLRVTEKFHVLFRLLYAAARHGHLPKLLAMIHNTRGVPIPGLILQVLISFPCVPDVFSIQTICLYNACAYGNNYVEFFFFIYRV